MLRRRSPSAHFGFNRHHPFLVQPRPAFRHEGCGCHDDDPPRRPAWGIESAGSGGVCPFRIHRRSRACMRDLHCARCRAVRSRLVVMRVRRPLAEYGVRAGDCMDPVGRCPVQRERTTLPDHDAGPPGIFGLDALVAAVTTGLLAENQNRRPLCCPDALPEILSSLQRRGATSLILTLSPARTRAVA